MDKQIKQWIVDKRVLVVTDGPIIMTDIYNELIFREISMGKDKQREGSTTQDRTMFDVGVGGLHYYRTGRRVTEAIFDSLHLPELIVCSGYRV